VYDDPDVNSGSYLTCSDTVRVCVRPSFVAPVMVAAPPIAGVQVVGEGPDVAGGADAERPRVVPWK